MTTIGTSAAVSTSMLLTQEQAQLMQNPPAKNLPQNQERSNNLTNKIATALFTLGCFAAFKSGNSLIESGSVYWEGKDSLAFRYWEGQNPLATFNDALAFAGASIALSTLGLIVSKTPKMINFGKNLISSNENRPTAIKIHEENTFPYKTTMMINGLVLPCFLGLGNTMLNSFMTHARSMLGMCDVTDVLYSYDSDIDQFVSVTEFTKNICIDASRHSDATFKISMIWGLTLLTGFVIAARNGYLKNWVEKVDLPAAIQNSESVKTVSENEQ